MAQRSRRPTDDGDVAPTEIYDPRERAPLRVISMKEPSAPVRVRTPRAHHVQLRAIAEVARAATPEPFGHLAPPRESAVRAVRARQVRRNVLWILLGAVLAVAIASAIWLIAG